MHVLIISMLNDLFNSILQSGEFQKLQCSPGQSSRWKHFSTLSQTRWEYSCAWTIFVFLYYYYYPLIPPTCTDHVSFPGPTPCGQLISCFGVSPFPCLSTMQSICDWQHMHITDRYKTFSGLASNAKEVTWSSKGRQGDEVMTTNLGWWSASTFVCAISTPQLGNS